MLAWSGRDYIRRMWLCGCRVRARMLAAKPLPLPTRLLFRASRAGREPPVGETVPQLGRGRGSAVPPRCRKPPGSRAQG